MSIHPNMTRRHFNLLAEIIADLPADNARLMNMKTNRPVDVRRLVAEHFISHFAPTNKHFKEDMFLEACGLAP